jgi:hypothetical protein
VLWLGFHQGDWVRAGFLAVYGSVVVGLLDNVIRSYVLHSNVKLHPLLAFVSVMGGIQLMGLWGVFVGPVVASCLHALVKIFNTELGQFSNQPPLVQPPGLDRDSEPPASPGGPPPSPVPGVVPSAAVSSPGLAQQSSPAGSAPGSSALPGSPQPAPTG